MEPAIAITTTLLLLNQLSTSLGQNTFTGDATTYGGNANGGTCGFQKSWSSWTTQSMALTAALNDPQWDNSLNCGRCAKVQHETNDPVIVQIVDKCPECKTGDLDFAPEAYTAITKKSPGRERITWSFVECPDLFVQGNVEVRLKEGSNAFWVAFQPQNFRKGIHKVEIKQSGGSEWTSIDRNEKVLTGFYFQTQNVPGAFSLRLTSVDGEVIETSQISSVGDAMPTQSQFGGGSGGGPNTGVAPVVFPQVTTKDPLTQGEADPATVNPLPATTSIKSSISPATPAPKQITANNSNTNASFVHATASKVELAVDSRAASDENGKEAEKSKETDTHAASAPGIVASEVTAVPVPTPQRQRIEHPAQLQQSHGCRTHLSLQILMGFLLLYLTRLCYYFC